MIDDFRGPCAICSSAVRARLAASGAAPVVIDGGRAPASIAVRR